MLDAVYCVNITTTSARIFSFASGDEDKEFNAYDYRACDEFSTQPPCTQMLVNVNVGKPIPVTDRNGIKNRRIFKALGMFWQKKAPANLVHYAVEVKGVKASEAKMVDCLGEHCFFEGWESATVQSDGTVHLDARWFGS